MASSEQAVTTSEPPRPMLCYRGPVKNPAVTITGPPISAPQPGANLRLQAPIV
jgi:hypothetical protein